MQGLDPSSSRARYLGGGAPADLRIVRSTIAAMHSEFASAAKSEKKPDNARLVLIDVVHLANDRPHPTLGAFGDPACDAGHNAGRRAGRRARLIERQLEALRWLEQLMAEALKAGNGVAAFNSVAPALTAIFAR